MSIDWAALAATITAGVLVVGWFMRLERRLNAAMTRTEHERICDGHQQAIARRMETLEKSVEREGATADRKREQLLYEIRELSLDMAVVQTQISGARRKRQPPQMTLQTEEENSS